MNLPSRDLTPVELRVLAAGLRSTPPDLRPFRTGDKVRVCATGQVGNTDGPCDRKTIRVVFSDVIRNYAPDELERADGQALP